jgi:hypothetical protein
VLILKLFKNKTIFDDLLLSDSHVVHTSLQGLERPLLLTPCNITTASGQQPLYANGSLYTDTKEKKIFLIYIRKFRGIGCKVIYD